MALSESIAAYEDCYEYFSLAMSSEKGIRVWIKTQELAGYLRMRMNQARALDRRQNKRLYDITDARYGKSEFDRFKVSVKPGADCDGGFWVYIEPWVKTICEVEEL